MGLGVTKLVTNGYNGYKGIKADQKVQPCIKRFKILK